MRAYLLFVCVFGAVVGCSGQCPTGLNYAGQLYAEGAFNSNAFTVKSVMLPRYLHLDKTYRQTTLQPSGGDSDTHSSMKSSEVPPGIYIHPSGTEDHVKGWAVWAPDLRVVETDAEFV